MYGRPDQIGKPIKCPDCGAQTVVPIPEKVKPKQPLAAMEGEQYELWGVDEAPSVAEMLAAQPKYIAVVCRMCQTLMHATEDQVGKPLKCPDCGTANLVPPPESPAKTVPVLARDDDDFQIDAALDPGDRPAVIVPPRRPMLYEEEREAERARQAEKAARGERRGPRYDDAGRPVMPRWPLVTRVLPFLISRGVPVRWAVLSVGLMSVSGMMLLGEWMMSQGEFGVVGGFSFMILGFAVLVIWLAATSAIAVTIVTESSEGNDAIEQWPAPVFTEWWGELLYVAIAALVSPCPGWLAGQLLPGNLPAQLLLFLGSMLVFFPIILLSQLDVGSPFGIGSARVLASLVRLPFTWLLFFAELAALAVVSLGLTFVIDLFAPALSVLTAPIFVAALILAARLLGRLAWKLAESMPATDQEK
jgi:DNA-directed RNA polymerase subunit RPC12/RpoP